MIFLDASFLVALFVENDDYHEMAVKYVPEIINEEKVISKLTIAETITMLSTSLETKEIREIYNNLYENFTVIEDTDYFNDAMKVFVRYDATLSFFDSMYMYIMLMRDIYKIASFDSHFENKDKIIRVPNLPKNMKLRKR
ncbi:type II toxin-antitoxin system VapC family toxin [Methanobrevibacter curvatus]|uniref:tRNA(FMet)-specific endonuclease VapC n=1 Tax=Methanobrevibacter curvatus TaxID=49547 RepID=A0A166B303_9EURY|nr:PIN domain-containing protein [Methanobrevibacter curvatus]KZX12803.1 tRNA(fMet)-specific endonuclease VapC [Methanobrevibacter curvatus]